MDSHEISYEEEVAKRLARAYVHAYKIIAEETFADPNDGSKANAHFAALKAMELARG